MLKKLYDIYLHPFYTHEYNDDGGIKMSDEFKAKMKRAVKENESSLVDYKTCEQKNYGGRQ